MASWVGTIIVAMTRANRPLRPRNRSFAKANPANVDVRTTETVTVDDTTREFVSANSISVLPKTLPRFSSRLPPGSRAGGILLICEVSWDAATNDQ